MGETRHDSQALVESMQLPPSPALEKMAKDLRRGKSYVATHNVAAEVSGELARSGSEERFTVLCDHADLGDFARSPGRPA